MKPSLDFEISWEKVVRYLLNPHHKDGGSKANLLLSNGFRADDPEGLATALYAHALQFWPGRVKSSAYGIKHVIDGPLTMPNGTTHEMRAIWQIDSGSTTARLITAY